MGKSDMRGKKTVGFCRNCRCEFTYVYHRKTRISCDTCKGLSNHTPIYRIPMHKKTEAERLSMRPDHATAMSRDAIMTKHDLQWSPTDDFARRVNQILQGERGLV